MTSWDVAFHKRIEADTEDEAIALAVAGGYLMAHWEARPVTLSESADNAVIQVRVNDRYVWVGEMDRAGEDAMEIQIDGHPMVGLRGNGEVITWNRDGEADTTHPEGWSHD